MTKNSRRKLFVYISLSQNSKKCHVFLFIFYLFSSTKSQNKRAEEVQGGNGDGTVDGGEVVGKGGRKMNILQIMCIHICKYKNDTC
jgi:hypothetical protein